MDPILALPPGLPPHDAAPLAPVPARIVATWPAGTFVENIAPLPDGSFAVSVLSEARIDRVRPDGTVEPLIRFDAPPAGLVVLDGALFATVGEPGKAPAALWRIDPATGAGEPWMTVEGAVFLNGITPFGPGRLLVAESVQGRLILIDVAARASATWCADDRLTPSPEAGFLPGANGVKVFGGHVVVSSNGRALLLRIPVGADGQAGPVETIAERLRADDIAFDAAGSLYLTTHIGHTLDRLTADGRRVSLAGPDQGLAGSTACAFGITAGEREALYVTTTGGIVTPYRGVLEPAKIVRLEVGAAGHPLETAL